MTWSQAEAVKRENKAARGTQDTGRMMESDQLGGEGGKRRAGFPEIISQAWTEAIDARNRKRGACWWGRKREPPDRNGTAVWWDLKGAGQKGKERDNKKNNQRGEMAIFYSGGQRIQKKQKGGRRVERG